MKLKLFATISAAAVLAGGVLANTKPAAAVGPAANEIDFGGLVTSNAITSSVIGTNAFGDIYQVTAGTFSFSTPTGVTTGNLNITGPETGIFSGVTSGTVSSIPSPFSPPVSLVAFQGATPLTFTLDSPSSLDGGTTITPTATGSTVGFSVAGSTNGIPTTGNFTTQFTGISSGTIASGTSGPVSFSGNLVATPSAVPEPSDFAGIATLGVLGAVFVTGNRKRFGSTVK